MKRTVFLVLLYAFLALQTVLMLVACAVEDSNLQADALAPRASVSNIVQVFPKCPCDYSAENLKRLGITGMANGCIVTATGAVYGTDCLFGPSGPKGCSSPLINVQEIPAKTCSIRAAPIFSDIPKLPDAELQACRNDVIQAAQTSGVTCVQR
jgi:hypothetical protein